MKIQDSALKDTGGQQLLLSKREGFLPEPSPGLQRFPSSPGSVWQSWSDGVHNKMLGLVSETFLSFLSHLKAVGSGSWTTAAQLCKKDICKDGELEGGDAKTWTPHWTIWSPAILLLLLLSNILLQFCNSHHNLTPLSFNAVEKKLKIEVLKCWKELGPAQYLILHIISTTPVCPPGILIPTAWLLHHDTKRRFYLEFNFKYCKLQNDSWHQFDKATLPCQFWREDLCAPPKYEAPCQQSGNFCKVIEYEV